MKLLVSRCGPIDISPEKRPDAYRALIRAVVYQQLTGKAAATILKRMLDLFPGCKPDGKFPTPDQILVMPAEKFRSSGLSGGKTRAIQDIARKKQAGLIPGPAAILKMTDDEIIERLTEIHGVGRWTVEMFLIFTLGRADVFPIGDYGVRKGYAKAFGKKTLPEPKTLGRFAERWTPYRTAAAWYFWRAVDLEAQ